MTLDFTNRKIYVNIFFIVFFTIILTIVFYNTHADICCETLKEEKLPSLQSPEDVRPNHLSLLNITLIGSAILVTGFTAGWGIAAIGGASALLLLATTRGSTRVSHNTVEKRISSHIKLDNTVEKPVTNVTETPFTNVTDTVIANVTETPVTNVTDTVIANVTDTVITNISPLSSATTAARLVMPKVPESSANYVIDFYDTLLNRFMNTPFVTKFEDNAFSWYYTSPYNTHENLNTFYEHIHNTPMMPHMYFSHELLNMSLLFHVLAILAYNADVASLLQELAHKSSGNVFGVPMSYALFNTMSPVFHDIYENMKFFLQITETIEFKRELLNLKEKAPETYQVYKQHLEIIKQTLTVVEYICKKHL